MAAPERRYTDGVPPRPPSEYFEQNCWMGVSFPRKEDVEARKKLGAHKFMWGSDYPHDEGTYPFTRECLRAVFSDVDPDELRMLLGGNAAEFYGFDLDALAPLAGQVGPTVDEIQVPLTDLPENPNEALLGSVGAPGGM